MAQEIAPPAAVAETRKRRRPAWVEYVLVGLVAATVCVARLLPRSLACALGRGLGRAVYFFGSPNFLDVGRHLRIAFGPDLDEARLRSLARGFWVHLGQSLAEALHLARWTRADPGRRMDLAGLAELEPYKAAGRGLLLISGHLGSWEVGPYALALLGYPIRLLHNPGTVAPLFDYLKRQRERSGMVVLSRLDHPWAMKKLLDRGAWLCIAADLNAGRRGTFVPFFGVAASSYLTPAALQQATGCPIAVATTARLPDGRHRFRVWRIIERTPGASREEELLRTTRAIHQALEEAIRAYPEQWLWNYRRWRSRPPGEVPGPDGLPPRAGG